MLNVDRPPDNRSPRRVSFWMSPCFQDHIFDQDYCGLSAKAAREHRVQVVLL
jgi:hypothetical protein